MPEIRPITFEDLEDGLAIEQHALDEALLSQPDLSYQVTKRVAIATSKRDAAKQDLIELEARIDAEVRHEASFSEKRITESEIASKKVLHRDVQQAQKVLLNLNKEIAKWNALKEAYQQRSFALRELVALYTINYYSGQEETYARNHIARAGKEGMNKLRRNTL